MDLCHQLALCKSQLEFVRDLDVVLVTDHLKASQILSVEDAQRVLSRPTDHERRRCLLDILPGRGPEAFGKLDCFLAKEQPWLREALRKNLSDITQDVLDKAQKSSHIQGIGGESTNDLTKRHCHVDLRCQLVLSKCQQDLIKDLAVMSATDYMLSQLSLSREEVHKISAGESDFDKRRRLLDLLPYKGPEGFDTFCQFLLDTQPWLYGTIQKSLARVEQDEPDGAFNVLPTPSCGPTRQELQEALRGNILDYVDNDPSKILPRSETGPYLDQPISADIITDGQRTERLEMTDIFSLLLTFSLAKRVFLYGTAGMGKSTLCRQMSKSWTLEGHPLANKFTFVFPIPLRLVRSRSLVDIICEDLHLLHSSCKERIKQEIDLNSRNILMILDSFEELAHRGDEEDIVQLIKGVLLKETTVLITTRPNQQIEKLESSVPCCVHAQLLNLTNAQIDQYVANYPELNSNTRVGVCKKFGRSFLERPINLWLLCYVAVSTAGLSLKLPGSQTTLLNIILQHILLAYLKKKKLPGFQMTKGSPMTISGLPSEVKSMLKEAGKLCFISVKDKTHFMEVIDDVLSKDDLLAFGLFAEGPEENTVVLPHQLFKEYLAALYLSTEEEARRAVLDQIEDLSLLTEAVCDPDQLQMPLVHGVEETYLTTLKGQCGVLQILGNPQNNSRSARTQSSSRPCLVDVLRSLGLDNVVRFLVGLKPATAYQLTKLFVIRQSKVRIVTRVHGPGIKEDDSAHEFESMHSFLHYELDLFQECSDEVTKTAIAKALLDALIITDRYSYKDFVPNRGSHQLLNCFTADDRKRFLELYFNCQLIDEDGRPVLSLLKEGTFFIFDSFVAGVIILHNCRLKVEELWFRNTHLPVQLIANNMADVGQLHLSHSTLYSDAAECVASLGLRVAESVNRAWPASEGLATISQSTAQTQLVTNVRRLRLLTSQYVMPATRALGIWLCDVPLAEVGKAFPAVSELGLYYYENVFFSDQTKWTSVRRLVLGFCDNIDLEHIHKTFPGLEDLEVEAMTILTEDRQTSSHNVPLRRFKLLGSHAKRGDISLSQRETRQVLTQMYPQAKLLIEDYLDEKKATYQDKFANLPD